MATSGRTINETMIAGADLSEKQFYAVKQNTTAREVVLAGNGDAADGILINNPEDEGAATVVVFGRTLVEVGTGGVTAGALVGVEDGGKVVVAATGDVVIGRAVEAASAGTRGTIDFFRGGNVVA